MSMNGNGHNTEDELARVLLEKPPILPTGTREFWILMRMGLLQMVDAIERQQLGMSPTTSEMRKIASRLAHMRETGACNTEV